ncbi:MAG: hypothetical protein ABUJ98_14360 [Hyphomicrobium sp.]
MSELTGRDGGPIQLESEKPDSLDLARWIADILISGGQVTALQRKDDDDEQDRPLH